MILDGYIGVKFIAILLIDFELIYGYMYYTYILTHFKIRFNFPVL